MRVKITKSKNFTHYSIIQDITTITGRRTTKVYENIGNDEDLKRRAGNKNPMMWLGEYVAKLNQEYKKKDIPILIKKHENQIIEKDKQRLFNGGYLFAQDIYYKLGLDKICDEISKRHQFKYDLNSILSRLIYGRILYPGSKLATLKISERFLENHNFDLQHMYRALEVINKESDYIQSELYKNSAKYMNRNNRVLYYDCTNFFFEIEQDDDFRKYGVSKENRPNPIVQMGLFMDGDGIPLAFCMNPGNTNEQTTLKPLEKKIIEDFNLSKIVVCTDAGLASTDNRKFNDTNTRRFITTQSIKKLNSELQNWVFDKTGWHIEGLDKVIDISKLDEDEELAEKFKNLTFYKEKWIKGKDLEQRIIVTFSIRYRDYQRNIRNSQIARASKLIASNPKKIGKPRQNDFKRFIETIVTTDSGEQASKTAYSIDTSVIQEEMKYDGLYAVCTNLNDDVLEIIKANHRRWEIEECFRIMKSEFKSRAVYLSREDRIKAHFTTCFIALMIFRYIEKRIDSKYTAYEILDALRDMNFLKENQGFIPTYTRTDLTDLLHDKFGFRTDFEILSEKNLLNIFKNTKK